MTAMRHDFTTGYETDQYPSHCRPYFWHVIRNLQIDTRSYSKPSISDHESYTKVQKGRLRNLKLVKLEGFEREVDIILFKEHLMDVFKVEPQVIEVRNGLHDRCLLRIPKRKTNGKTTKSNKWKFSYKFVEEVEDNKGLCSKHPHIP